MAVLDEYFCDVVRANPQLRPRVGNPDELRSNHMGATLELLRHRVTAPEAGIAESVDGKVITAPQEQIEQGFVKRDYRTIAFPECPGVAQPALAVPDKLICGARISMLGSVKQVAAYLRQPGPLDYALACTNAALNQLAPDNLPDDLTAIHVTFHLSLQAIAL